MANIFQKASKAGRDYIGSISGDANQITDTLGSKFGSLENFSNTFDQRISDGLTDLLTGVTGIRTTKIPEISTETLKTREANREARAQALNAEGRTNLYGDAITETTLKYPENFPTENDEASRLQNYIHFRSLRRRNNDGNEVVYDIFLYVPDALVDGTALEYEAEGKGLVAGLIAKFMGRGQGGTDQGLGATISQTFQDAVGGAVGKAATGTVINPMSFQIFKGVSTRDFTYSFELYPDNEQESKDIREICYAFKKSSLPGIAPDTGNKVYTFPNEWAIRYHGPMKDWIDYPMVSVLKKVDVDYNIGGNSRHWDGSPSAIKLDLSFTEVFQLDRNKYDQRVAAQTNQRTMDRENSQERGSYADVMGLKDSSQELGPDIDGTDRSQQGAYDTLRESKLGTNSLYEMEKRDFTD